MVRENEILRECGDDVATPFIMVPQQRRGLAATFKAITHCNLSIIYWTFLSDNSMFFNKKYLNKLPS